MCVRPRRCDRPALALAALFPLLAAWAAGWAGSDPGLSAPTGDSSPVCPAALAQRPFAAARLVAPPAAHPLPGYAAALRPTQLGWPRLDRWCVWIEPGLADDPWQQRWHRAVVAAVEAWAPLLPVQRVIDPAAAQVRILRRRPSLRSDGQGRPRASHGRALLTLQAVQRRPGQWLLEPAVELQISPGQRPEALQATAVHELGHAFGLWGHSEDAADALAAVPGPLPVLQPSARDRATLRWLQQQPTAFGAPLSTPP